MATAKEIVKAYYDNLNECTVESLRPENQERNRAERKAELEAEAKALEVPEEVRAHFLAELKALCQLHNIIIEYCDSTAAPEIRYARKGESFDL